MTESARLKTSVDSEESAQFTALAAAQGVSVSHLLKRLVRKAIAEKPQVQIERLNAAAKSDKSPAEKYTVRLMGADAAQLEERAMGRQLTPSGYVAHLLRAHLRANPPMPYREFQELTRSVNELEAIRGALQQLTSKSSAAELLGVGVSENILKLLTPLKLIRQQIRDTLVANAKSWGAPDA
jgi:hypothetical protein